MVEWGFKREFALQKFRSADVRIWVISGHGAIEL